MSTGIPKGLRLMAAGALSFSVMSAIAKLVGQGMPLFELVFGRSLVVALLAAGALRKQRLTFAPRQTRLLIQRGLFGFAALSCYFYSIIHLPLADATVLYFMNPVLTALAAAVVLGEHMGWKEVALVTGSLLGVVVVARPSFLFGTALALDPFAVMVGIAAAVLGAASYITIRQIQHDPPLLVVFYFSAITVLLSAPFMVTDFVVPTLTQVALLVLIGTTTHLGQLWITWGFRLERAGRASAVGYLQIVFAAGWGWLLFHEIPDVWTWVGAGLIISSTLRLVRLHPTR